MRRLVTSTTVIAVSMLIILAVSNDALADHKQISRTFNMPLQYDATIQAANCLATPGPQIEILGDLTFPGLRADVVFSNPIGTGSPQDRVEVERVIVPQNEVVPLPQQSVVGLIGGNPFMWLQLTDEKGKPLTSEIFLGQCDQGSFTPTAQLAIPVEVSGDILATECESVTGPMVVLNSIADVSQVNGKLIFRSSSSPTGQGGKPDAVLDLVVSVGQVFPFPADPAEGGIGGNPLVSMELHEEGGAELASPIHFGRCEAIVK